MSIKSIDFQMLIPRTPEMHKAKQLEINNEKSNAHIINLKNIENQDKLLKQVSKSDKLFDARINKDGRQSNPKEHERNKKNKKNNSKEKTKTDLSVNQERQSKIDIRI